MTTMKITKFLLVLSAMSYKSIAQHPQLQKQLQTCVTCHSAITGISLKLLETKEAININNIHKYPMQSTYKVPLAMYILDGVDKGAIKLEQKIHITNELRRNTWSPLAEKYPKGNVDLTVRELLEYMVSASDNNACDILFKLAKGPKVVNDYIHKLGIKDMNIAATEAQMGAKWDMQYTNWVNPSAMIQVLEGLYNHKYISEKSSALLLQWMTNSANSDKRIKGLLPKGTEVAHKTGTSGTDKKGLTAAVNDIGIITLPNGKHLAIAVFVSDFNDKPEVAEKTIADIAKAAYDEYDK